MLAKLLGEIYIINLPEFLRILTIREQYFEIWNIEIFRIYWLPWSPWGCPPPSRRWSICSARWRRKEESSSLTSVNFVSENSESLTRKTSGKNCSRYCAVIHILYENYLLISRYLDGCLSWFQSVSGDSITVTYRLQSIQYPTHLICHSDIAFFRRTFLANSCKFYRDARPEFPIVAKD